MQEIIQKILKNEIMYYVVVPIILPIIGWIKSWYDIRIKNRKMGYWKLKYRRATSFYDIAIKTYLYMLINLIVMAVIRLLCTFWIEERLTYIIGVLTCSIVNLVIVICFVKNPKTKIEFYTDGRKKQLLLFILGFIFSIGFVEMYLKKYQFTISAIYFLALIIWACFLAKYTDMVYILDKSCADIYVNGSEAVKCIYAGSMKKNGNWIYVVRYVGEYYEEIRIKESEIVRIDYYGEPDIIIQKLSLKR